MISKVKFRQMVIKYSLLRPYMNYLLVYHVDMLIDGWPDLGIWEKYKKNKEL